MGNFSLLHWLVVLLIVMLLFGPSKVEHLGKSLGRAIRGFKDGMNEIDAEAKDIADKKQIPTDTTTAHQNVTQSEKKKDPSLS